MNDQTVVTTLISTSGAVVVAVVALATNTFWINRSLTKIDRRLEIIETDLKEFFKIQSTHAVDIQHLKDTKQDKQ